MLHIKKFYCLTLHIGDTKQRIISSNLLVMCGLYMRISPELKPELEVQHRKTAPLIRYYTEYFYYIDDTRKKYYIYEMDLQTYRVGLFTGMVKTFIDIDNSTLTIAESAHKASDNYHLNKTSSVYYFMDSLLSISSVSTSPLVGVGDADFNRMFGVSKGVLSILDNHTYYLQDYYITVKYSNTAYGCLDNIKISPTDDTLFRNTLPF